jgi:hypothetical protein
MRTQVIELDSSFIFGCEPALAHDFGIGSLAFGPWI